MLSDRRTGRTTRLLLRALLAASEKKGTTVVVCPTYSLARCTFSRLRDFAKPIGGCKAIGMRLTLPNESVIRVCSAGGNGLIGLSPSQIFFDAL